MSPQKTHVAQNGAAVLTKALTLAVLLVEFPDPALCSQLDSPTIIERSVAANQADWDAAPGYSFQEKDRDIHGSKTYQVRMIDGSPYQTLTALNGSPLSPNDLAKQQAILKRTVAERHTETQRERDARIAKYEAERRQEHLLMQQMTEAFDFKLLGESRLGSREVYVLKATPRKGYKPPNMDSQVLAGMQGQLWIDKQTFQWVKVTAHVFSPVSIEGFLAQVEPGTYFSLEKMPVADGIWLPKHYGMKSRSKILFFIGHNTQADETYSDYRRSASP